MAFSSYRGSKIRWAAGMCAVCMGVWSAPARAQSDEERAGARAAATQGANAFMERRWSDAIDMFTRAESLVHSPVHMLYLARSHAQIGKLVKSREYYIKLTSEELPGNASSVLRDAKSDGEKELAQLEPRIPYVSVVVQGAGPKPVTVTMDGVQVPPALLGVPRPVDPGEHRFQAFADGMESSPSTLTLVEARSETVVLTLVAATGATPATPAAVTPAATSSPTPTDTAPPPSSAPPPATSSATLSGSAEPSADSGGSNGLKIGGWAALGVGVVGVGVGTVFALRAKGKEDDADKLCDDPGGACPDTRAEQQAEKLDDEARSANTVATIGFIAGGVGIAAGVTMLILSGGGGGSEEAAPATAGITPWIGLGSAGVSGRFW